MKITKHAGKGSQRILSEAKRGAVNDIIRQRPSINTYAKAVPNVVRNGPSVTGKRKP